MTSTCPECGATWTEGVTCETYFHEMLFWEQADMEHLGIVHHLMVLSFHLQHPSRYSPEGLRHSLGLLVDFLERGITPQNVRRRDRDTVDSGKRVFKIVGSPESHGVYEFPVAWTMRIDDVLLAGSAHYVENVTAWAHSILESLRASNNLTAR